MASGGTSRCRLVRLPGHGSTGNRLSNSLLRSGGRQGLPSALTITVKGANLTKPPSGDGLAEADQLAGGDGP
jgi:hypothetical protein